MLLTADSLLPLAYLISERDVAAPLFPASLEWLSQEPGKLGCRSSLFQILLGLSQISVLLEEWEGVEAISHLGNFFKICDQGPNPDLLIRMGRGGG